MADFPGEGGRDLLNDPVQPHEKTKKLVEEAVKKAPRATIVPPPPVKSHKPLQVKPKPRSDIDKLARDFKDGIDAVQRAIDQIARARDLHQGKFGPGKFERVEGSTGTIKERLQTLLQRETQTITRISEKIPIPRRHIPTITADFQRRAEAAFATQVPQTLAALMKVEKEVRAGARAQSPAQPAVVLRPGRGSPVEALMKVAKSIRAGRLPFVPTKTRKQAQQLIDAVVGRPGGSRAATMDRETERLIERYKLVPLAVRSAIAAERATKIAPSRTSERLDVLLREAIRPANREAVPISEHHAQRLEAAIPRFRDEGAVYGGPAIVDAGETRENVGGMDVIYREGSSRVSSPEAENATAGGGQHAAPSRAEVVAAATKRASDMAAADTPRPGEHATPSRTEAVAAATKRTPDTATVDTPQPGEHKAPAADMGNTSGSRTHGGLGASVGGGTVGAAGGPMRVEGTLRIEGMADWVAKVEGFMRNV